MNGTAVFRTLDHALAEGLLREGDLLLFRGHGLLAAMIQIAGRSAYSHAGMAADWSGVPMALEATAGGVAAVSVAERVRQYGARIDVFRANPENRWPTFDRAGAVRWMLRMTGRRYGYRTLLRVALLHLPFARLVIRPALDDRNGGAKPQPETVEPICSEAVAMAYRLGGGVDPVLLLADRYTEPADLARSPFFEYTCTLTEDTT